MSVNPPSAMYPRDELDVGNSYLVDVSVAISAIVISKTSIGNHSRQSNNLGNLLCNLSWRWARNKIEIKDSSYRVVLKVLTLTVGVVDFNIHTVRVDEDDAMSSICSSVINIDWVVSIQVFPRWCFVGISSPKGPTNRQANPVMIASTKHT